MNKPSIATTPLLALCFAIFPMISGCGTECTLADFNDVLDIELVDGNAQSMKPMSGVLTLAGDEIEFDCADGNAEWPYPGLACVGSSLRFQGFTGPRIELALAIAFFDSEGQLYFGTGSPSIRVDEPNGDGCGQRYQGQVTMRVQEETIASLGGQ